MDMANQLQRWMNSHILQRISLIFVLRTYDKFSHRFGVPEFPILRSIFLSSRDFQSILSVIPANFLQTLSLESIIARTVITEEENQRCPRPVLPSWRSSWISGSGSNSTAGETSSALWEATTLSWISSSTSAWRRWRMAKCERYLGWVETGE